MNYVHNIVPWLLNTEYCVLSWKLGRAPDTGGDSAPGHGITSHTSASGQVRLFTLDLKLGKLPTAAAIGEWDAQLILSKTAPNQKKSNFRCFLYLICEPSALIDDFNIGCSPYLLMICCWWWRAHILCKPERAGACDQSSEGAQPRSVWHGMGSQTQHSQEITPSHTRGNHLTTDWSWRGDY